MCGIAARAARKRTAATAADRSGQMTHDERIWSSAFGLVGRPAKRFQPTIAPTIACEVETGRPIR